MRTIKFYRKRGGLDYGLYLLPAICFALAFFVLSLEGSEKVKWLEALNVEGRADEQWLYGGLVTVFALGIVTFIAAYKALNDNKGRKAELKISAKGIYGLPTNIHPIEIPWANIISKPELTEVSGKKVLYLKLSDYVPEGYKDELNEVYIDINRLSTNNMEILDYVLSFYNLHS